MLTLEVILNKKYNYVRNSPEKKFQDANELLAPYQRLLHYFFRKQMRLELYNIFRHQQPRTLYAQSEALKMLTLKITNLNNLIGYSLTCSPENLDAPLFYLELPTTDHCLTA